MMILDKLWNGDVCPGTRLYHSSKAYSPHLDKMEKCEDAMKSELSEAGKAAFEDFMDAGSSVSFLSQCDSFIAGFRTGALIMLDVLYPTDEKQDGRV